MAPIQKLKLLSLQLQSLIENKKIKENSSTHSFSQDDDNNDDQLLLSRLISELESLKGDGGLEQLCVSNEVMKDVNSAAVCDDDQQGMEENSSDGSNADQNSSKMVSKEIVKELKNVKRQNFITHCLLSVMILLTVTWQLSEVSLILKVKDRVSHPFRTVGSMIKGMIKGPGINGQDGNNNSFSSKQNHQTPALSHLMNIPELPQVDFPDFGLNGDD